MKGHRRLWSPQQEDTCRPAGNCLAGEGLSMAVPRCEEEEEEEGCNMTAVWIRRWPIGTSCLARLHLSRR